ncbi:zf-HC2 domain-containing protein [Streptomyces sp. 549]|uniref:anti-sigma factor family protein n=1 Tax=Streptomyces sp. 549 TaxID=3049076 RepID=UPI0024C37849|nr:zf-HC2 domain-containing protein [Streptomyces sp. 549]MDK1473834.1 zf-HC2 domain-containing protein [Streptomyces sp. 549]
MTSPPAHHTDVGAYAIGALDSADAARFEEHLAACQRCAIELEELMGLGPLLAEYSHTAPDIPSLTPRPSRQLMDNLMGTVVAERRGRKRRRLYLVAAAAALVVGGPLAGAALLGGGDQAPQNSTVQAMFESGDKLTATDPNTKADAVVSLNDKEWGTEVSLKLANVSGPRVCGLVAVGKDGTEQTVTTWAVPEGGGWKKARIYHGGAAYERDEIDRFEVRTIEGEKLVTVTA